MALSADKIQKLRELADRGIDGERDNARQILERNGVDWRKKKTGVPKMENPPPPPPKPKRSSSFDTDPFFNKDLRIEGVYNELDAMIVMQIVIRVLGKCIGKRDTLSNYWGLPGVSTKDALRISVIWATKREQLKTAAVRAVYDAIKP